MKFPYTKPKRFDASVNTVTINGVTFKCYPWNFHMESTLRRFVDSTLALRLKQEMIADKLDTPLMGDIERRVSAALGMPVMIRVETQQ